MIERQILVFAGLAESIGARSFALTLDAQATCQDLLHRSVDRYPQLAAQIMCCRVALDHSFVSLEQPIAAAQEIALIPPVSGGHNGHRRPQIPRVALCKTPLEVEALETSLHSPKFGAYVRFCGYVRDHNRGQRVLRLYYEAYESMALHVLRTIVQQNEARHPGVSIAVHHRIGDLSIGDCAVAVITASAHRDLAYSANRACIEDLKRDLPIWKHEYTSDGALWLAQGP